MPARIPDQQESSPTLQGGTVGPHTVQDPGTIESGAPTNLAKRIE